MRSDEDGKREATRTPLVYLVDDDDSIRKSLQRLLGSVGLDVEAYASAGEFLETEPVDRPACLVLDVRMPGLSGLDLQEELARRGAEIPIVFMSGHGTVPISVRAMKGGAVDFLQKPVDEQVLLDAVHRALEIDREQRAGSAQRREMEERIATLTPREKEVFLLVVQGLLNKQIAGELGTAEKTVKVHRGRVMQKMQADSLADLVRMAERAGLGDPPAG